MFNRIYDSLYRGSMVGQGVAVFALWPYVLGNMKPDRTDGLFYLEINPLLVAATFGDVTPREVEEALEKLCAPDASSRSKEQEGRRLVKVGQFRYWVVNGREYQDSMRYERRKASAAVAMQEKRSKVRRVAAPSNSPTRQEQVAVEYEKAGEPERAERVAGMVPTAAAAAGRQTARQTKPNPVPLQPVSTVPEVPVPQTDPGLAAAGFVPVPDRADGAFESGAAVPGLSRVRPRAAKPAPEPDLGGMAPGPEFLDP